MKLIADSEYVCIVELSEDNLRQLGEQRDLYRAGEQYYSPSLTKTIKGKRLIVSVKLDGKPGEGS